MKEEEIQKKIEDSWMNGKENGINVGEKSVLDWLNTLSGIKYSEGQDDEAKLIRSLPEKYRYRS